MLWAARFFAFMRVGEMAVPSDDSFDPSVHLSVEDIAVDDPSSPAMLRVTIKQSKTDPFSEPICREGVGLFVSSGSSASLPCSARNGAWPLVSVPRRFHVNACRNVSSTGGIGGPMLNN